jgi:phosphonate transport system ATP-binding protein
LIIDHGEEGAKMEQSIVTDKLTKVYPNGTCAVRDVSLTVKSDDLLIILGPSGAGKSTLLRCLNRLLEPTSGQVKLNDWDITHVGGFRLQEVRKRVGMIFQQFNLVHRLSVLENVLAGRLTHCPNLFWHGLSLLKIFPKQEKEIAFECLKKVKIEHLAYQRADTLSGGQQQRVAIARALTQEPYVFLADEPVASLDPASAEIVMETLQDIHETQKIPVIVNLHQIGMAKQYAKRLFGMANGRIVFSGKSTDLDAQAIETIYDVEVDERTGRLKRSKNGGRKYPHPKPEEKVRKLDIFEKPKIYPEDEQKIVANVN